MRIGLLAYPLLAMAVQLGKPSAVGAFERAGAISPETSRKPSSLEVPAKAVRRAVKKGLLVGVGDGRYYLDRSAVRRSDLRGLATMGFVALSFVPLVWLLW